MANMESNLTDNRDEAFPSRNIDFNNTEIAFADKSNKDLKKSEWLFSMMNKSWLVKIGASVANFTMKIRFPFSELVIKNTIFSHFCGGENLMQCQKTIDKFHKSDILSVLDYGAEAKDDEDEFDAVVAENMRAIQMAASNTSVPIIVVKVSGLIDTSIFEKMQKNEDLSDSEKHKYDAMVKRLDSICDKACSEGIGVFIDAEESWIQKPIDDLALEMMEYYNKEKVIIYNTYQLYRWEKLTDLINDHDISRSKGFLLGAKLVRGAYMEKERKRAEELKYISPIHSDKISTDKDYNRALEFCIQNHKTISFCCASHNADSNYLLAKRIDELRIEQNHPHINFCQLQGMSDNITYNLAKAGYNAAKYVVYGPVRDVIPYLIRRTQENTSITGEMGRELKLITEEMKRRGI